MIAHCRRGQVGDAKRDVSDVEQDVGSAVSGAFGWIADGIAHKVREVENFGQGVESSYDQGEQEGRSGDRW